MVLQHFKNISIIGERKVEQMLEQLANKQMLAGANSLDSVCGTSSIRTRIILQFLWELANTPLVNKDVKLLISLCFFLSFSIFNIIVKSTDGARWRERGPLPSASPSPFFKISH